MTEPKLPVFFFAPFVSSPMKVDPAWIDYNGYMNAAYYHVLFERAVEEALGQVGLGADYAEERQASSFMAEAYTAYKRGLSRSDVVRVTMQLLEFDEKRVHFYMEMRQLREGWIAATFEGVSLHVDRASRRVFPFPEEIQANLLVMKSAHARLNRPESIGRVQGISRHDLESIGGTRH
jgi:acyl-CoA thioester hydrolase